MPCVPIAALKNALRIMFSNRFGAPIERHKSIAPRLARMMTLFIPQITDLYTNSANAFSAAKVYSTLVGEMDGCSQCVCLFPLSCIFDSIHTILDGSPYIFIFAGTYQGRIYIRT